MTAKEDKEAFLTRWSRRKAKARQQPLEPAPEQAADPKAPAPELPPIDKLTPDSDYRVFFHPQVGEDVRRAALKKLFSDPHYNVMDGLDVYIDDYSKSEPIPAAMLAGLRQAQNILAWAKQDEDERAKVTAQQAAAAPALDTPAPQPVTETGNEAKAPEAAPVPTGGASGQAKS